MERFLARSAAFVNEGKGGGAEVPMKRVRALAELRDIE
jgi:hypothetical protein